MKKSLLITIVVIVLIAIAGGWWFFGPRPDEPITTFEECVSAGNPVMESYPRQCRADGQTFIEFVGNEIEKTDLIRINTPRPNQTISSPLTITGEARGNWFFEASFPIVLTDWDGKIIAQGIAQAKGDWMTINFVPFEAILTFTVDKNAYSNRGSLILKKDNPSGLSENDDALEIPIVFAGIMGAVVPPPIACTMEAKLCPDGSAVGRTGPNCEFTACPTGSIKTGSTANLNEKILNSGVYITPLQVVSDSRCPTDVTCIWAGEILVEIKLEKDGVVKIVELKEGGNASIGESTVTFVSVLPEKNSTVSIQAKDYKFTFKVASIIRSCLKDADCSAGFECVQECGPPVSRQDDSPLSYYCQLKGYIRNCPICLAKHTQIDTPFGAMAVENLSIGTPVWTVNKTGERVVGFITLVSKTAVPSDHKMVQLVLNDGRTLLVSPGHPTIDGRTVGDLVAGNEYDGSQVRSAERVSYDEGYTYDLLPSGETGFYFANSPTDRPESSGRAGILIDSTLHP